MQQHAAHWPVEEMAKIFDVSRSGYYQFIKGRLSKRKEENKRLLIKIKACHDASRHTYGSPRIHADLRENGETCSRKRVSKIMQQEGIAAKMKRQFKVTTKANPEAIPAPNLLAQNFTAETPNQRWVADFTYVSTMEGWLYVATVLDLFSRRIVGLSMSDLATF